MNRTRILAVTLLLLTTACFDQPVRTTMRIVFAADGSAVIRVERHIVSSGQYRDNPSMLRRLEEERRSLLAFDDEWTHRLRRLEPDGDRVTFGRAGGELETVAWEANFDVAARVVALFRNDGIGAELRRDGDATVFEIYPRAEPGGTAAEFRRVEAAITDFASAMAAETAATAAIYRLIERQPERARIVLARALEVDLGSADVDEDQTTEEETRLLEDLDRAIDGVVAVLVPADDADASLEELSRRVFDPLAATLAIEIEGGEVLDAIGFEPSGEQVMTAPELSFWSSLTRLEGKWVEPDLALARVRFGSGDQRDQFETWLSRPRVVHRSPRPDEARAALVEALAPPELMRLRFRHWPVPASESE